MQDFHLGDQCWCPSVNQKAELFMMLDNSPVTPWVIRQVTPFVSR